MVEVLLASEAEWVVEAVVDALEDAHLRVSTVSDGRSVLARVAKDKPDLVIVDFQIGSMGGMAICKDLRLESGANRLERVPILLLLDRTADTFMAKHSEADSWITKPLDALRIRRSVDHLLGGQLRGDQLQGDPLQGEQLQGDPLQSGCTSP